MSARTLPVVRGDAPAALAAAVVVAGSVVLAVRPSVAVGADARLMLFAVSYVAIASAAIAVPAAPTARDGRDVDTGAVAGVALTGVAAVALASVVTGPAVPAPMIPGVAVGISALAAVAEEALFRRLAFARLERYGPAIAIGVTAALFGLVHLPGYGTTALPVDLAAGAMFGWQRWASGTWLVPAGTHAFANVLAGLR